LELGGQNPLIILRDADVDYAVNAAAFGGFLHQGQICTSTRRVIVEKPIAKKFVKKVSAFKVDNPKEHDSIIGPLVNKEQFNKVKNSVDAAGRDGTKILCGRKSEELYYYPTVLTNVKPDTPFSCEETFGPVVSVIEVKDEDEAVVVANVLPTGFRRLLSPPISPKVWLLPRVLNQGSYGFKKNVSIFRNVSNVITFTLSPSLHRQHLCPLFQAIQIVSPSLHHLPACFKVCGPVVGPAAGVSHGVGKLMFY
jgi:hypothetical protein